MKKLINLILPVMLVGAMLPACSQASSASNSSPEAPAPAVKSMEVQTANRDAAAEKFTHQEGMWESKIEYPNKNGEPPLVKYGSQEYRSILGGNGQLVITKLNDSTDELYALMTFNAFEQTINSHLSGSSGMDWSTTQVPTSNVTLSEVLEGVDREKNTLLRTTTVRREAKAMDIKTEVSRDNGNTWEDVSYQYLTR